MRIFFTLVMALFLYGETEFAEPRPDIDNVRKMVFGISSGEAEEINHVLSSINNVMKYYRPENTQVKVIAYYHGIKALLKDNNEFKVRVEALMTYDVEFIACGNTMRTLNIKPDELLDGVEIVTAGIVEINEAILKGYNYLLQ